MIPHIGQIPGHSIQLALKDDTVAWQTGMGGYNDSVASTYLNLLDDSHLLGGSCHDSLARPPTIIRTHHGLHHTLACLTMGAGRGTIPSLFFNWPWLQVSR
jgi:hypothetical protein